MIRSCDLPALLSDTEDDRLAERLWLIERLSGLIDDLWREFLSTREGDAWGAVEVPAIKAWAGELEGVRS